MRLGPHILLMPSALFMQEIMSKYPAFTPALAVCDDRLATEVSARSREMGFALPAAAFSSLDDARLSLHWRELARQFAPDGLLRHPPTLSSRHQIAPSDLTRRLIVRQLGPEDQLVAEAVDTHESLSDAFDAQILLAAFAALEERGASSAEAEAELPDQIQTEGRALRIPLSVGLPGVPRSYERRTYERRRLRVAKGFAPPTLDPASLAADSLTELDAVQFITAHDAVSTTGVGLVLPQVPSDAWVALANLERHFRVHAPRGPVIKKMMRVLTNSMTQIMTEEFRYAVTHASVIAVHGNFPLGLLTLPGDSDPLLEHAPLTYRPLLPLTRALQNQVSLQPPLLTGTSLKVLVVECIPETDPVGQVSRIGWQYAREELGSDFDCLSMQFEYVSDEEHIRRAIRRHTPHVLVISAHGVFRGDHFAGLQIGNHATLGIGLGPLPPLVVLSACHSAPRATGAVSIGDLLLREGATAVLTTQVPIDVRQNAMLMVRFFLYVALSMTKQEDFANVLEVWHHVQRSNAVLDILHGSRHLEDFGASEAWSGRRVLAEFMAERATNRLRVGHVYADSERVLIEIAEKIGRGPEVRNWLQRPAYVPESLFYAFVGCPELIRFTLPSPLLRRRTTQRNEEPSNRRSARGTGRERS